jgi:hypothetical protein
VRRQLHKDRYLKRRKAVEVAQGQRRFTIFSLVHALTRLTQELRNAGDRTEAEQKVGKLLSLAA